ncbi:hypothetical protein ACQ9LF_06290 [Anaerohalosphaeraceae bacterium U12dextr]
MKVMLEIPQSTHRTVEAMISMGDNFGLALEHGLHRAVHHAAAQTARRHLSGQSLRRRTGSLARALTGWRIAKYQAMVGIQDQSAVNAYAWLLGDEIKTIVPTQGKYLAIPIGQNLTKAGVARYDSPRSVPGGFFLKTKSGKLLFGIMDGAGNQSRIRSKTRKTARFVPLFVMKESVTIKGTGVLAKGVLESVSDMTQIIQEELETIIGSIKE